jgi:hypothetical protein
LAHLLDAQGDSAIRILLAHLGSDTVGSLEIPFKVGNTILYLLAGLVDLCEGKLMVLFCFFVLELKVTSLALLLDGLVLFPVAHSLLEPLLHESGVARDLVDLGCAHLLQVLFPRFLLVVVSSLGEGILALLLVVKLLHVTVHYDLLLGDVTLLEPLVEESGGLCLVLLLRLSNLHGGTVISDFASY